MCTLLQRWSWWSSAWISNQAQKVFFLTNHILHDCWFGYCLLLNRQNNFSYQINLVYISLTYITVKHCRTISPRIGFPYLSVLKVHCLYKGYSYWSAAPHPGLPLVLRVVVNTSSTTAAQSHSVPPWKPRVLRVSVRKEELRTGPGVTVDRTWRHYQSRPSGDVMIPGRALLEPEECDTLWLLPKRHGAFRSNTITHFCSV